MAGCAITGRLVRLAEPETYERQDGSAGTGYAGAIVLDGDSTIRVEYKDSALRDAALARCGVPVDLLDIGADGMVETMPLVVLGFRPFAKQGPRGALSVTYLGLRS